MINCNLKKVAGDYWNISKLARATDKSVNVIRPMWNDTAKTYNKDALNEICKVLNCTPGDLIVFAPTVI